MESKGSQGSLLNVLWAFVFIATGGLLFGYVIGINGEVLTKGQLQCPEGHTDPVGTWGSWGYHQCYILTPAKQGLLSSLNLVGACASSLFCFRYADFLGRKMEVQIAAVLYMAGAVVAAAIPALWGIFLGFLIYGLGIGFAMHAAPAYIAEISPADVRGRLVSAKEAVIVLGMFLGFLSGYLFSLVGPQGWRLMVLCSSALGLIMLCGIARVPQSPRFLVLQAVRRARGEEAEGEAEARLAASRSLQFYRRATAEEVEPELQSLLRDLKASFEDEEDSERQSLVRLPGRREEATSLCEACSHRRPMLVGCGLVLLQQVTGQPSVLYFATNIFRNAGFGGSSAAMQTVGVGLVKLVATLFTVWKVDNYGRRVLLFVGISMMTVALALLVGSFYHSHCMAPSVHITDCPQNEVKLPESWADTTIVALMLYVSGYAVGFGPISWLMISEVFPLKIRGSALSIAAVVNFSSNIAMTIATPVLMDLLPPFGIFAIFLGLAVASLLFVYKVVPETRGISLEQIETLLKS